jgi:hypothetical protein
VIGTLLTTLTSRNPLQARTSIRKFHEYAPDDENRRFVYEYCFKCKMSKSGNVASCKFAMRSGEARVWFRKMKFHIIEIGIFKSPIFRFLFRSPPPLRNFASLYQTLFHCKLSTIWPGEWVGCGDEWIGLGSAGYRVE